MIVDKTVLTDTAEFMRELGITDDAALKNLCEWQGKKRDIGTLERLRDFVLRGCFANERQLRDGLYGEYGADTNSEYFAKGIDALVALRTYGEVSTRESAEKYCGDMWEAFFTEIENLLGQKIPEWFFPALASVAHRCGYQNSFEQEVVRVLIIWEMGGDSLSFEFRALARSLANAWRELSQYKLGENEWWIIMYPTEDDYDGEFGGYDEF